MKPPKLALLSPILAAITLSTATRLSADILVSGSATINYTKSAWNSVAGGSNAPGFEALVLDEAFDQGGANSRTGSQILTDEIQANPSYLGLVYAMNGPAVSNLSGRTAQPTDFSFDSGNLTTQTGAIGLGGVTRWAVNPALGGGGLLFGDFTLKYDVSRQLVGGSGWALTANIAPAGVVFDLLNVNTSVGPNSLTISADLGISYEVANFLFATPANQGVKVGDFQFTGATAVPEPSVEALLAVGALALGVGVLRRQRTTV